MGLLEFLGHGLNLTSHLGHSFCPALPDGHNICPSAHSHSRHTFTAPSKLNARGPLHQNDKVNGLPRSLDQVRSSVEERDVTVQIQQSELHDILDQVKSIEERINIMLASGHPGTVAPLHPPVDRQPGSDEEGTFDHSKNAPANKLSHADPSDSTANYKTGLKKIDINEMGGLFMQKDTDEDTDVNEDVEEDSEDATTTTTITKTMTRTVTTHLGPAPTKALPSAPPAILPASVEGKSQKNHSEEKAGKEKEGGEENEGENEGGKSFEMGEEMMEENDDVDSHLDDYQIEDATAEIDDPSPEINVSKGTDASTVNTAEEKAKISSTPSPLPGKLVPAPDKTLVFSNMTTKPSVPSAGGNMPTKIPGNIVSKDPSIASSAASSEVLEETTAGVSQETLAPSGFRTITVRNMRVWRG